VSDELREQLTAARAAEIARAADQLKNEMAATPEDRLERIKAYTALLSAMPPPTPPPTPPRTTHETRWAIAVALCAALTAGVLWATPLSRTRVLMKVDASAVEFTLAEAWAMADADAPSASPGARLEVLTEVSGSILGLKSQENDAWMRIDDYRVQPSELSLQNNGHLVIQVANRDGAVHFFSRGAELKGALEIDGRGTLSAGVADGQTDQKYNRPLEDSEVLRFSASGKNAVSTMLAFSPASPWDLRNLAVNQLSFSWDERAQPGGPARRTPVLHGEITLFDSSTTVTIGEGERLSLERLHGHIIDLRIDKQIHLSLEGDVGNIVIGTKGFERRLTPTYLEYFRSHPSLGFFWSAAVFLGGSLWSAKRLLLS
jgi:hypothetical protein